MTPLHPVRRAWLSLAAALLFPTLAAAQLQVSVIDTSLPDGAQETILATGSNAKATHDLGIASSGVQREFTIRVRNLGASVATIEQFSAFGAGFTNSPVLPPVDLGAGQRMNVTLRFRATTPARYSANLRVNGVATILLITVVPGPELSVVEGCSLMPGTTASYDFGEQVTGADSTCTFALHNPSNTPLTVNTLSASGEGFTGPEGATAPLTLSPEETIQFAVRYTPPDADLHLGQVIVEGTVLSLQGRGLRPALPAPIFEWGTEPLASGQQRRLTIRLPEPAPFSASGQMTLELIPDSSVAQVIDDDPSARFLDGAGRQIPFSIVQGQTQIRISGLNETFFQTGTTAARLRFTLTGIPSGFAGGQNGVDLTIPPKTVTINLNETGRRAGGLDVHLIGFDNTYSIGVMRFTFRDAGGQVIGTADSGPVRTDFRDTFRVFYEAQQAGSLFDVLIRFPVSGDISVVHSVDVEMVNSAGTARIDRLEFP